MFVLLVLPLRNDKVLKPLVPFNYNLLPRLREILQDVFSGEVSPELFSKGCYGKAMGAHRVDAKVVVGNHADVVANTVPIELDSKPIVRVPTDRFCVRHSGVACIMG